MNVAPMMLTGCTLKPQVVIAMVTKGVPQDEVRREVVLAWLDKVKTNS